jgi:hypothetical protein
MTNLWVTLPVCFFYRIHQPTDPLGEQQSVEFNVQFEGPFLGIFRRILKLRMFCRRKEVESCAKSLSDVVYAAALVEISLFPIFVWVFLSIRARMEG